MKKFLLLTTVAAGITGISSAGIAADLPVRTPAPVPVPPPFVFSWTGFYLGGNIGGAWAQRNVTDTVGRNFSNTSNGVFIGGGQVGFNYQIGGFVMGVEGDFDWAANSNNNDAGVLVPGVGAIRVSANDKWITTVAARLGFAVDRLLFYGKFGGGWVGADNFTITNVTTGASIVGGNSSSNSGFLVGGGLEYAIANNWTVKGEYDYLGLSNRTFVVPVGAPFLVGDTFRNGSRNIQMFKVGFNYLFKTSPY